MEPVVEFLTYIEKCIELVSDNRSLFLEARQHYRMMKLNVSVFKVCRIESLEFLLSKSYDLLKFGCLNSKATFYKEDEEGSKKKIEDPAFIQRFCETLFESKGLLNGEVIFISERACDAVEFSIKAKSFLNMHQDTFMTNCHHKVRDYILHKSGMETFPPLKKEVIAAYIDEVFPPLKYAESGFSKNKKNALLYFF